MVSRYKIWLKTILKVVFSGLALILAINAIDWSEAWSLIQNVSLGLLTLSLFFFVLSQLVSAYRLRVILNQVKIDFKIKSLVKLYLIGMLYNFAFPGGIGGDGYKGLVLKQNTSLSTKSIVRYLLVDRASGLLGILILGTILVFFSNVNSLFYLYALLVTIIGVTSGFFAIIWIVKELQKVYTKIILYSVLIQALQVTSVFCVLASTNSFDRYVEYGVLFLVSSIASVFPLSVGGIGVRELAFVYGAKYLGVDESIAIMLSVTFLLITGFTSLFGLPISLANKNWAINDFNVEPDSTKTL